VGAKKEIGWRPCNVQRERERDRERSSTSSPTGKPELVRTQLAGDDTSYDHRRTTFRYCCMGSGSQRAHRQADREASRQAGRQTGNST
jgi:hypothetical protein